MKTVTAFAMFGSWETPDADGPRYVVGGRADINGVPHGYAVRVMDDPAADHPKLWGIAERVLRQAIEEAGRRL